jgi:hypothetical protein
MPGYVQKIQVPVRVTQPGLEHTVGTLALAPQAQAHEGPETLLELLNGPLRMIPFIRGADQAVLLLTRLSIDWVEADAKVEPSWIRPRNARITREERVQLRLGDGRRIEGLLQVMLPGHLNRASDFLNAADDFFPLVTQSATVLVNKARVTGVRLFEVSPEPIGAGRGAS